MMSHLRCRSDLQQVLQRFSCGFARQLVCCWYVHGVQPCLRGSSTRCTSKLIVNIMSRFKHASVTADRMYLTGRPPTLLGKRCRSSAVGSASSMKPSSHCADVQHPLAVHSLMYASCDDDATSIYSRRGHSHTCTSPASESASDILLKTCRHRLQPQRRAHLLASLFVHGTLDTSTFCSMSTVHVRTLHVVRKLSMLMLVILLLAILQR